MHATDLTFLKRNGRKPDFRGVKCCKITSLLERT